MPALYLSAMLWGLKKPEELPFLVQDGTNGPHEPSKKHHLCELYTAAKIADENAKLTAFTTRPAIFSPVFNWLTEFMVTTGDPPRLLRSRLVLLQGNGTRFKQMRALVAAQASCK